VESILIKWRRHGVNLTLEMAGAIAIAWPGFADELRHRVEVNSHHQQ
jgi:hypothetical protein